MREETFAITPRFRSNEPVSSTMTSSENGYTLSPTTKGALIIFPPGALLLLDSWHSRHNPALPSLASPTSGAGRTESVCCPRSAAKLRGDHESAQTRPCDKFCNKNDWVLSQHLWPQSVTKNHTTFLVPQAFFVLYVFLERNRHRGSPMLLSSPPVSLVSANRERARDVVCSTCSNRLKTSSNPVNSQCAWEIWQKKEISGV